MTSQSPRIYLYKITFEEVPYYYYGVHKEKRYDEYYMGSPTTHKWCWELYTPKKQILEIFEFSDEGWLEAQEVEKRLIKPFYNDDKWCLNESCGGKISLRVLRENGRKNGKKRGNERKMEKSGVCGRSKEKMSEDGRIGAQKLQELGMGIHGLTSEQKAEAGRKGGKISVIKNKKDKVGIFSLSKEQLSENSKKANSQRWMCLETGYTTNSGALSKYQKARGIDTTKRVRVS